MSLIHAMIYMKETQARGCDAKERDHHHVSKLKSTIKSQEGKMVYVYDVHFFGAALGLLCLDSWSALGWYSGRNQDVFWLVKLVVEGGLLRAGLNSSAFYIKHYRRFGDLPYQEHMLIKYVPHSKNSPEWNAAPSDINGNFLLTRGCYGSKHWKWEQGHFDMSTLWIANYDTRVSFKHSCKNWSS